MSWFRNPKTTQERRANQQRGSIGYARAKRNMRKLPTSWDDLPKNMERSWKKSRKTQYKETHNVCD